LDIVCGAVPDSFSELSSAAFRPKIELNWLVPCSSMRIQVSDVMNIDSPVMHCFC
jgi:hypothetical protein